MNARMCIGYALALLWATAAAAGDSAAVPDLRPLDTEIQALKARLLELNADVRQLEKDVLVPVDTQLAVFVSLDVGRYITLDAVQVRLDGKEIANYLYDTREIDALARGGVHRIYTGNIKSGTHKLLAFVIGRDSRDRALKLAASTDFTKGDAQKYVEIQVVDVQSSRQPEVRTRVWD